VGATLHLQPQGALATQDVGHCQDSPGVRSWYTANMLQLRKEWLIVRLPKHFGMGTRYR